MLDNLSVTTTNEDLMVHTCTYTHACLLARTHAGTQTNTTFYNSFLLLFHAAWVFLRAHYLLYYIYVCIYTTNSRYFVVGHEISI